ncbi:MAG: SDR family NAD(P)-dependent oxidoreductase, partial [Pseudomonadota bacterium]|nr:SDR family NAD(P)-dependent oxidoreductase [Pseudomonadota bacterium]
MKLGLEGKSIMVAAASRGLGNGIARAVAEDGARVSIAAPTEPKVHEAASALGEETGAEVISSPFDARDPESIQAWRDRTVEAFGTIDGLVVNAGGPPPGQFDDFDDDD